MKFLKNEKWKLEEATRCICLLVSIFYGFAIFLGGLINIIDFVADFLPSELYDVFDSVTKILNFFFIFNKAKKKVDFKNVLYYNIEV